MYPDYKEERVARVARRRRRRAAGSGSSKAKSLNFKVPDGKDGAGAIPIRGLNGDLPVRFAPNGGAVPGDRIVGIMTPGEGITIYPIQSPALKDFEDKPERWLDVRWDIEEDSPQRFPARIEVQLASTSRARWRRSRRSSPSTTAISTISHDPPRARLHRVMIDLEVYDLKHLNAIIAQLRAKAVVANVERVNG